MIGKLGKFPRLILHRVQLALPLQGKQSLDPVEQTRLRLNRIRQLIYAANVNQPDLTQFLFFPVNCVLDGEQAWRGSDVVAGDVEVASLFEWVEIEGRGRGGQRHFVQC